MPSLVMLISIITFLAPSQELLFRVHYFLKYNCASISFPYLQACLPIIDDLSRSAMRPRHWKQLLRVTGGAVQISNEGLTRMTLGQLLELGLHGKLSPPLLQNSINTVSFASRNLVSTLVSFLHH